MIGAAVTLDRPLAPVLGSTGTTVFVIVVVLIVIGLVMVAVAAWLVRTTRRDPAELGPLEVMGGRRWRRADAAARTAALAAARRPGAPEPAPMVAFEPVTEPEPAAAPAPAADPAAGDREPDDAVPGSTAEDPDPTGPG